MPDAPLVGTAYIRPLGNTPGGWVYAGTASGVHVSYNPATFTTTTTYSGGGYVIPQDMRWTTAATTPTVTFTVTDEQARRNNLGWYGAHAEVERRITAEWDREAQEARAAVARRIENGRSERVRAARERARELLRSQLNETQRADYDTHRWFEVTGSAGTRFRIGPGSNGNVSVYNHAGERVARICAHPDGDLPEPDIHLAQMLALMVDERGFVARANCHEGRPVRYGPDGRMIDPTREAETWHEDEAVLSDPLITGVEVRVDPAATPDPIQDQARLLHRMQRYAGR